MSDGLDRDFEQWLEAQGAAETDLPELREAHRLLEQDLFRLADPLPPEDFVQGVMEKVEANPHRRLSFADLFIGSSIFVTTLALAALVLFKSPSGALGLWLGDALVSARQLLVAGDSVMSAVWTTHALPSAIVISLSLLVSLVALKRGAQALNAPKAVF
jgi:hypothetical protein